MEKEKNLLRLWPHTQNSLKFYTGALRLGEYYENILMQHASILVFSLCIINVTYTKFTVSKVFPALKCHKARMYKLHTQKTAENVALQTHYNSYIISGAV